MDSYPQPGGGSHTTTYLILGGVALVVVVMLVMNNNNNNSTNNQSTPAGTTSSVTSNTGTPLNNNNSLLGFIDPSTGIQWVLDASNQWVSVLPAGTLPPNYTPGAATMNPYYIPPTNTA